MLTMRRLPRKTVAMLMGSLVLMVAALALRAHSRRPRKSGIIAGQGELVVPHMTGAITLDGDLDDPGWLGAVAQTGAFLDKNGGIAKPFSEARLTWGDGVLYMSLYAADEDIRAEVASADGPVWRDDSFHFVFDDGNDERVFDISVNGVIADGTRISARSTDGGARPPTDFAWSSGAHVSREIDGTLNEPRDDDEEWALEIAIPLESIGLTGESGERVGFAIHRCDSPKNRNRTCSSWGEREPMVLVLR